MGDRVAVLHGGVLQQYAAPRDLYDHPANLFVADFIGSPGMNLYEASVSAGELVLGTQRLALGPVEAALAAYQGRKVIAGVRPEDLVLDEGERGAEHRATLTVDVRAIELLGSDVQVYFAIDAPTASATALETAASEAETRHLAGTKHNGVTRLHPRSPVRPGTRVVFSVDSRRLHFFDPDTGQSVS